MNPFHSMPPSTIALGIASVTLGISDWLLRRNFVIPYLNFSVKLFASPVNSLQLTNTTQDEILEIETARIYDDSNEHCIWMQCKFKNHGNTMGLIKKWKYSSSLKEIESEETRISIGQLILAPLSFFFVYQFINNLWATATPNTHYIFYVGMLASWPINMALAHNRLRRESAWALEKITRNSQEKNPKKFEGADDIPYFRVPIARHLSGQFAFLVSCALIQYFLKIEIIFPYFILTGIHFMASNLLYGRKTIRAFEDRFHGELRGGFGGIDVFAILFGKKTEDKPAEYWNLRNEIRRSFLLTFSLFASVAVGAIMLGALQMAMEHFLGITCVPIKF